MAAAIGSHVPDYRGLFLRHVGGNSAILGVAQGDAIRNIVGEFGTDANSSATGKTGLGVAWVDRFDGGAFKKGRLENVSVLTASGPAMNTYTVTFDSSRIVPTTDENRPVNMAVKYIIFRGD